MGLLDKSGSQVVSYTYDSWGKLISIDGSLKDTVGIKNPYRYRGYRYDSETGLYHLINALYDLENRIYLDAIIQPGKHPNETKALVDMIERSRLDEKTILLADRGYESYNILAHAQEKGWKYFIWIKDLGSRGILTNLPLPDT